MIDPRAVCFAIFALSPGLLAQDGPRAPRYLRVELQENPVAIDEPKPRFSWEVDDSRRGARQTAWRVLVSTNFTLTAREKGDSWDSGETAGSGTCQIEYGGKPLATGRTYWWVVRTWDAEGQPSPWSEPAQFTLAPLAPADWRAQWIEAGRAPSADAIGHHSGWLKAEDDYPYVQLDFGGDVVCEKIRLHPARPSGDLSQRGELFPLRVRAFVDQTGRFADKAIRIAQYDWEDIPDAGAAPIELAFSRHTLRAIRIVATKIPKVDGKGYAFALGEVEVLDGQTNIAPRARITVGSSLAGPGWSPQALNDGALVPDRTPGAQAPDSLQRLRGSFTIDGTTARARLHASALGLYELSVNGVPVGDQWLAPGWTDYRSRVPYQTFDIASLLHAGENVIGVQLAPGWYAGRLGLADQAGEGRARGFYGEEPRFLAQLDIVLDNGKRIAVQTDSSWRWSRGGPLLGADLFDGEIQDARREAPGWDAPRFPGADWRPVEVHEGAVPKLFAQRADPVRIWAARPALSARRTGPEAFVYDFGQNLAGVVRLSVAGANGTSVSVRHAEVLDEAGQLYTANLRGAAQTDRYVLLGGPQMLEPRFTVHGFRYAEVSGFAEALALEDVQALALGTDVAEIGTFECSDPLLNQIWRNAGWSLRSNLVAIPTDCPQRDERLGWMGDVQIVAPTALDRFDAACFLTEWLADVRGAQTKDGRFPDFAPHPFDSEKRFAGAPGWGDAGVLVPWEIWRRTRDRRLLEASVEPALRWIRFVAAKNAALVWREARGEDYGDWLNGSTVNADGWTCEGCEVPKELFATAFFARSAQVTAQLASAAGRVEAAKEAQDLAQRARQSFRTAFGEPDGRLAGDAQAAYALALDFELHESPAQARAWADRLAARVRSQGKLTCGIQTAARALLALSRWGHHDLAVDLARRKTLPSWGYMIERGATTMWERWDAVVPGRGFQDPGMNSFNHFALGAIGEWMVREVAGIDRIDPAEPVLTKPAPPEGNGAPAQPSEGQPEWPRWRIAPRIGGGLQSARAEHRSITGWVRSSWKVEDGRVTLECTLPPGPGGSVVLRAKDRDSIRLDGKPLAESADVRIESEQDGAVILAVPSGAYRFESVAW